MPTTAHQCPQCHAPLPAHAPQGLCPACLLKAAAGRTPADLIDIGDPVAAANALPQFEILELLGQGGMGVVYKARQKGLDRLVALKILPPADALSADFVARFTREAQSLAKLTHPNIVAIYEFGESGGLYFFSMEFVDGVNLRALLSDKKLTSEQALAIVPKVCDALTYAHEEGVVHRDIKPENILLDKKGRVKIADFGLAKLLRRESLDLTLTATGVMLGTLRYMAPEQMDKPETVDHRADIYSLGVVIYEMLTGDVPMGRFLPPSQKAAIDPRLDEIVLHTLEREPERRYQHVSEVKTDMENISGLIERLPVAMRKQFGFEYRSPVTLFGVPLLHVATGTDPSTGQPRQARGIFAIGARATGIFAFGGIARGLVAFGGLAIGGLAMGGASIGIVSTGGFALGLFFAFGGLAVAPVVMGGLSAGYIACGGLAAGAHTASSLGADRIGVEFMRHWNNRVMVLFCILFAAANLGQSLGIWIGKRALARSRSGPVPEEEIKARRRWGALLLAGTVALMAGIVATVAYWSRLQGKAEPTDPASRELIEIGASIEAPIRWLKSEEEVRNAIVRHLETNATAYKKVVTMLQDLGTADYTGLPPAQLLEKLETLSARLGK